MTKFSKVIEAFKDDVVEIIENLRFVFAWLGTQAYLCLILAFFTHWIWNSTIIEIFALNSITYFQAWKIMFLLSLIFRRRTE